MDVTLFQAVTLAIAVVGAVLGVLNTWRAFDRDRVKIRVNVNLGFAPGVEPFLLVEVVNLSGFEVTITHFGFTVGDGSGKHIQFEPQFLSDVRLPVAIKPRASMIARLGRGAEYEERFNVADCAYVNTACGLQFKSRSINQTIAALQGARAGRPG